MRACVLGLCYIYMMDEKVQRANRNSKKKIGRDKDSKRLGKKYKKKRKVER